MNLSQIPKPTMDDEPFCLICCMSEARDHLCFHHMSVLSSNERIRFPAASALVGTTSFHSHEASTHPTSPDNASAASLANSMPKRCQGAPMS